MAKKYIDANLLREELQKLKNELKVGNYYLDNSEQAVGYENALNDFESLIDSLQQEQKPAEWSDTKELVFKDICKHLKEEGYNGWIVLLEALRNGEFQAKQEWSDEDEKIVNNIVSALGQYIDYKAVSGTGSGYATPRYAKEIDWLKSLPLNLKKKNEDVAKLCSNEWSEEDEDMLNSCISSIEEAKENRYAYKETDGDTSYDHEIDWLKSLRPSWKPSEEQMGALLGAEGILRRLQYDDRAKILASLYEQLKQL